MENISIDKILSVYPEATRDNLIPILQDVQEQDGYISRDTIRQVSKYLSLPESKIYGVATFYNQFRFEQIGKHHIQLCRGTACHVKGSAKLLDTVRKLLGVEPGKTTKDKLFSLETVACMGACGLAPAVSINGEIHAKVTPKSVIKLIMDLKAAEENNARA